MNDFIITKGCIFKLANTGVEYWVKELWSNDRIYTYNKTVGGTQVFKHSVIENMLFFGLAEMIPTEYIHGKTYRIISILDIFKKEDIRIALSTIRKSDGKLYQNPMYKKQKEGELFFSIKTKGFNNIADITGWIDISKNDFILSQKPHMSEGKIGHINFINWGEYYLFMIESANFIGSVKYLVKTEEIENIFYNEMEA